LFGKTSRKFLRKSASILFRCWLALVLFAAGFSVLAQQNDRSGSHVNLIVIDGMINPAVVELIKENIKRAHADGAKALIIQLDTPGGLLDSTQDIVKDILGAPIPVIVYVAPSGSGATSAGVFVTMAAHIAAMAPGTSIGAAHPVTGGGEDIKGTMGEKVENFTASFSEAIAQKRGRNTEFAIQAVRRSISITEKEALEKKVIDIIAKNIDDLLEQASGKKVDVDGRQETLSLTDTRIERFEMSLKQKIINALSHPNIAYLLLMAGMLGLYMEFSHPGVIFPGVAGAICLLLALTSLQILPFNYAGLLLILLGVALLVGEAFVPSFGILGIGGAIALGLGSLLLFDTEGSDLTVDRSVVFAAVGTLASLMILLGYLVFKSQKQKPTLGLEGLVGEVGEVRTKIDPTGKIFVHGEYWNAEGDGEISIGEKVEVVGFERMCLKVRRLT